ncbi:MAG: hypothetical protein J4215_00080, partial [Candidatus Diapherotrites archaeon]|nr:hypothetical protein [Candidatus Diapherotrites archaeon]
NTAAQSVDVLFEPAGGGSTSESCGNNICEVDENASVCSLDCPNVCGDRACTHTENNFSCPFDCAIGCGDGVCGQRESKFTCPTDCDPLGGQIPNVTVPSPTGNQTPVTVPLTPQNKACESDSDCGVSTVKAIPIVECQLRVRLQDAFAINVTAANCRKVNRAMSEAFVKRVCVRMFRSN